MDQASRERAANIARMVAEVKLSTRGGQRCLFEELVEGEAEEECLMMRKEIAVKLLQLPGESERSSI